MARQRVPSSAGWAAAILAAAVFLGGCARGSSATDANTAGDIPDSQAFVAYRHPSQPFTVQVPEGWSRTEAGGVVTFTDKLNSITLESRPAPVPPTAQSATETELPALRSAATHFTTGNVSTVARKAGPAVLITYQADSPPDPVAAKVRTLDVERYEFWRNGTTAVLTLSAPHGSDNVDPWRTVTDSFAWTG